MLFEFLFGSLFQPQKTLGTNNVFHPAGIGLRCLGINTSSDKLFCKKAVAFINGCSNLPAYVGQVEKVVFVHREKTSIP